VIDVQKKWLCCWAFQSRRRRSRKNGQRGSYADNRSESRPRGLRFSSGFFFIGRGLGFFSSGSRAACSPGAGFRGTGSVRACLHEALCALQVVFEFIPTVHGLQSAQLMLGRGPRRVAGGRQSYRLCPSFDLTIEFLQPVVHLAASRAFQPAGHLHTPLLENRPERSWEILSRERIGFEQQDFAGSQENIPFGERLRGFQTPNSRGSNLCGEFRGRVGPEAGKCNRAFRQSGRIQAVAIRGFSDSREDCKSNRRKSTP
jgi:hypothetical protein